MEGHEHSEHAADKSNFCRLEWIAWAIEVARRRKDGEKRGSAPARTLLDSEED